MPDSNIDEITKYLQTTTENGVSDPLHWWYERRHIYPGLSRMARDYLTIPATSVNVERVFSEGRVLLSYLRNRLQVDSTRALLCVGEWCKKGVIKERDLVAALKGTLDVVEDELESNEDEVIVL
ncbi:hypothetical protein M378DRAFT_88698 [Amanita muscaria Koide BX008]|uniref:HAT C-terminal dimerisation domain-containing protein n=1 Tax=Amanita muscaria (strain Koide BX008) TaxID=946122 RepID=A0A0C2S2H1_AMAMK|nr:hypothetical protein M378DRAFT_88698 [Amanita muscaria Koide BX008]